MIAIPAVDLRDGACVQLVGGSYAHERVRLDDPLAVARAWRRAGFRRLHLVDLDAASGVGSNGAIVESILGDRDAEVQVGGGVRSRERADQLFASGATRVVVGTKAIEDPEWITELATRYPARIVVAADVRGRQIVTHGWSRTLPLEIDAVVRALGALPLAGLLVTGVHVEGQMQGPDTALIANVVASTSLAVIASGGVATVDDLRALRRAGAAGAVIGMALYTGAIDARATAQEFCE
jgi:phosphoribosylformimino-5-aminoimidazole carboxamide ribotide isomerase